MKCQSQFSGKSKKKNFKFSSAEIFFIQHAKYYPLNCQSQQLSSALSSCDLKSFLQTVWTQIRLLLKEYCLSVCKNRFENFAIFSRQHKQTTFSDAGFLGSLRVNTTLIYCVTNIEKPTELKYHDTVWYQTLDKVIIIRKTSLYNFDPLKPHFYIVKQGFTGVYIIFLFLL